MMNKVLQGSKPLTPRELDRAERRLGRKIPRPYREFLGKHNGGHPDVSDFRMAGVRKGTTQFGTVKFFLGIDLPEETVTLEYVLEMFRDRVPARLFPFARDPGGNLICIAEAGSDVGKIYFWDHEREADDGEPPTEKNLYVIADSFGDFLNKLGDV